MQVWSGVLSSRFKVTDSSLTLALKKKKNEKATYKRSRSAPENIPTKSTAPPLRRGGFLGRGPRQLSQVWGTYNNNNNTSIWKGDSNFDSIWCSTLLANREVSRLPISLKVAQWAKGRARSQRHSLLCAPLTMVPEKKLLQTSLAHQPLCSRKINRLLQGFNYTDTTLKY